MPEEENREDASGEGVWLLGSARHRALHPGAGICGMWGAWCRCLVICWHRDRIGGRFDLVLEVFGGKKHSGF